MRTIDPIYTERKQTPHVVQTAAPQINLDIPLEGDWFHKDDVPPGHQGWQSAAGLKCRTAAMSIPFTQQKLTDTQKNLIIRHRNNESASDPAQEQVKLLHTAKAHRHTEEAQHQTS